MRWWILGGVVMLGGCLKENPAWEPDGAVTTGGLVSSSSGEALTGPTSEAPTSTTGDPGTTDASGGSTNEPLTSMTEVVGSTGEHTTGDPDTTGAPAPVCKASELVALAMPSGAPEDTGVVPSVLGSPCPWSGGQADCGPLNFGTTGFFRLVNDEALGANAALIRFPVKAVADGIFGAGKDLEDLIGARLELVIWEPKAGPAAPVDLEIHMLHPDNTDWREGQRDAQPAQDDDSSALCRAIDKGDCDTWAQGDALAGATALGLLHLTPENAVSSDADSDPAQYHARLRSEPLGLALLLAYQKGEDPSLAVTLATRRDVGEGEIGIKMRESEWPDPTLYAEFCTDWDR
ncbi:MAG TPA: hypothetical protein VGB85_27000 [Nannocystis sp.]|jgi:hypothetical protein